MVQFACFFCHYADECHWLRGLEDVCSDSIPPCVELEISSIMHLNDVNDEDFA